MFMCLFAAGVTAHDKPPKKTLNSKLAARTLAAQTQRTTKGGRQKGGRSFTVFFGHFLVIFSSFSITFRQPFPDLRAKRSDFLEAPCLGPVLQIIQQVSQECPFLSLLFGISLPIFSVRISLFLFLLFQGSWGFNRGNKFSLGFAKMERKDKETVSLSGHFLGHSGAHDPPDGRRRNVVEHSLGHPPIFGDCLVDTPQDTWLRPKDSCRPEGARDIYPCVGPSATTVPKTSTN